VSLKKLGRYELIRVLGKGAMGVVYEGRDPNLDRRVAIKTVKVENLSEEAAAEYEHRFRTEARSAARLQHPNIVSVYDSDRDGDIAFLVMEYIQGDDLKHHLDRGVRYSLEQSLKIIRDLLSALDYAHKQSIVHRDIKPANLLIEPGGRVKLTDFGVARIQDSGDATRTQGSMVGTLKYMSPEQVQGQKIDSRADLFSVGVVLYQLLTDKRPFDGDNDFSIIHQIIGHNPAAPSSFNARLPTALDAVVSRALAKDREERFATARDFAVALQSAIRRAEDQTVVPPENPNKRLEPQGTNSRGGRSVPGSMTQPGGSTNTGTVSIVAQELELVYWKDVKDSADPEELEGFLEKFPAGIYADLARRRLRRLSGGGDSTNIGATQPGVAAPDPDMEATRLRFEPSRAFAPSQAAPDVSAPAFEPTTSFQDPTELPMAAGAAPDPSLAAPPAADDEDFTRTVIEPRPVVPYDSTEPAALTPLAQAEAFAAKVLASDAQVPGAGAQAAVPEPAAVPARADARAEPAAKPTRAPIPGLPKQGLGDATDAPASRKKPPVAVLAGIGIFVAAGIALAVMLGREDAPPPVAMPAPAASSAPPMAGASEPAPSGDAAGAAAVASSAPDSVLNAPVVVAPASAAAAASARPTASQPRRPASRPAARVVPPSEPQRPIFTVPVPRADDQPPPPPRPAPPPPAPPPTQGASPVEQCRDKVFLSREFCLAEQCEKPGTRNHPLCVKRREEIRLREESKQRAGPQ
jgi:serine/threonine-protein kinase